MQISLSSVSCLLAIIVTAGYACQPGAATVSDTYGDRVTNPSDSLQKNIIIQQLDRINRQIEIEGQRIKFRYPLLNETDTLDYFILQGKLARVSMNMDNGEGTIWPTFFLKDGELIHVRLRKLVKDSTVHYAQEEMAYLKEGKIFYIEERRMDLQPNELPALLRLQPYTVSRRTFGDFEQEYMQYWPKLKQAVDSHYVSIPPTK